MAGKSTISITFKLDGNNKGFKDLAKDAEGLRTVMQGTVSQAQQLKGSVINFAALASGIQAASSSLSQLQAGLQSLTDAYAVQEMAETKLETVMRQRMSATNEDIQAIKTLASEQQKLGVIGDEVQLSGAQQVATFLTSKSSIETLLPAMNNLIAQQKGLSATSEDARNVGTLMGKAMQGQVSALRRVGISFTEAEAEVMKFGTEQERASMLAEIITNNVGEMNSELAKTDSGQAKQVANALGDIKEQMGSIFSGAMPLVIIATQSLQAMAAVVTLSTAFKALNVSVLTSVKTFALSTAAYVHNKVAALANSVATKVMGVSAKGATVGVGALTVATVALYAALTMGVSLVIMGIVAAFHALTGEADDAAEEMDDFQKANDAYIKRSSEVKAALEYETNSLKALIDANEDTTKAVAHLNNQYGEAFGTHKTAAEWYDILTKKSQAYARAVGYEAKVKALATRKAENEIKLEENYARRRAIWASGGPDTSSTIRGIYDGLKDEARGLIAENKRFDTELTNSMVKLMSLKSELSTTTAPTATATTTTSAKGAARGGSNHVAQFREEAKTLAQINENIEYYQQRLNNATIDEAAAINKSIKLWQDKANAIKEAGKEVAADLGDFVSTTDDRTLMERLGLSNVADTSGASILDEIIAKVQRLQTEQDLARAKFDATWESVGKLGQAFSSLGSALELPELNIAGTLAQAIATMVQAYAAATLQASQLGPIAWAAFAATGLGQLAAIITSVKSMAKFADGGIVSGPTIGLMGEYAGARSNPEVIAPLNKLRGMLADTGSGQVEFKIEGRTLVGVLSRVNNLNNRR